MREIFHTFLSKMTALCDQKLMTDSEVLAKPDIAANLRMLEDYNERVEALLDRSPDSPEIVRIRERVAIREGAVRQAVQALQAREADVAKLTKDRNTNLVLFDHAEEINALASREQSTGPRLETRHERIMRLEGEIVAKEAEVVGSRAMLKKHETLLKSDRTRLANLLGDPEGVERTLSELRKLADGMTETAVRTTRFMKNRQVDLERKLERRISRQAAAAAN